MNETQKKITKENFPVFKRLFEEVILKGKEKNWFPGNSIIGKMFSKKEDKEKWHIPEKKANEIIRKISGFKPDYENRGRRLQALINAAYNDDYSINCRDSTLEVYAEFVLEDINPSLIKKDENGSPLYWETYLEKHKNLIVQDKLITIPTTNEKDGKIIIDKSEAAATLLTNIPQSTKEDLKQENGKSKNNLENSQKQSQQKGSSKPTKNKFTRQVTLSVLIVFFTIILISYFAFQRASKQDIDIDFTTSFKNINTIEELYNTGWSILDLDTNYIQQGLKNANGKGLQLYTLPGDYWITDTMRRFIKNTIVLAIPRGDFKVQVSLAMSDFGNLNCQHQQAGIILLNDTFNLANNLRFTVIDDSLSTSLRLRLQEVYSKAKPETNRWGQSLNDISPPPSVFPNSKDSAQDLLIKKLDKVWLQINKYRGHFVFQFKTGGNDRPFFPVFIKQFNFEPKFICIAAFQGQVNYRDKSKICDAAPIIFSDFHISPNDKDDKILLDELIKKYQ